MRSALYEGWVRHRRRSPVEHTFRRRLFLLYADLAELSGAFPRLPLLSTTRPNLLRFRRADYLGPADLSLDEAVRRRVAPVTGRRPTGPIRVLTQPRMLGYLFNPVTFYYVFADDEATLACVVAEITNTPWGERHAYVLPAQEAHTRGRLYRYSLEKCFHVSPFMPMDVRYDWRFSLPGRRLLVHMESEREGERFFDATLSLVRRALTPATLHRALLRHPAQTLQVTASIYAHALALRRKGAPFFVHPRKLERRPAPSEHVT